MSSDRKDDIMPEWSDKDMDWLDDIIAEYSTKPKPQQTPAPTAQKTSAQPKAETSARTPAGGARQTQAGNARQTQAGNARASDRQTVRRSFADEQPVARRVPASQEAAYEKSREGRGRRIDSRPILIGLIAVLVLGMIFAGWQLTSIFRNYHRDRSAYEELANRAIVPLAEHDDGTEEAAVSAVGTAAGERVVSELPLSVDWEYLRSINSDIVGWLYCPDTVINYPVVQTNDQEFYLTHGFDRSDNTAGTLFADGSSVLGIEQSNYIVYGHNMKDESMFGTFKNYVDRSYYDAHPTMYYLTPNGSYRIDLVCAHIAESFVTNLPGYFSSASDYQSYLNAITSDAFWVNYDAVTTERQLFSMSTCTSAAGYDDARLLLFGSMVPIQ